MKIQIDMQDLYKKITKALKLTGIDAVESLQLSAPVAGGFLKDNISYDVTNADTEIILNISMPYYAKFVEWGTAPHMPPVEAIREWCIQKGIPEEAAFPIALKIKKQGTRPQPFIRPYLDTKLLQDLEKNLKKV